MDNERHAIKNTNPKGKTCTDCVNWSRCEWIHRNKPDLRFCEFSPSRFTESMISKFADCIQENKDMAAEIERLKEVNKLLLDAAKRGHKRLDIVSDYGCECSDGCICGYTELLADIRFLQAAIDVAKGGK